MFRRDMLDSPSGHFVLFLNVRNHRKTVEDGASPEGFELPTHRLEIWQLVSPCFS